MRYNAVPGNSRGHMSTEIKMSFWKQKQPCILLTVPKTDSGLTMKVCTPLACLIFTEARRGLWIPETGFRSGYKPPYGVRNQTQDF